MTSTQPTAATTEVSELIERLRGPVFGTQTALDAAAAIETWKARAERLADMHRDMCVVAGQAIARAETAEATLAAVAPVAVSVKGLEWRENPLGNFVAETIVGQYFVFKEDNVWNWVVVDISAWRNFPSSEAAKAAAQADFNARILSSIIPATKGGEPEQ